MNPQELEKRPPKNTLREQAERIARDRTTSLADFNDDELKQLVQELHVSQIELELQNEELRTTQRSLAEAVAQHQRLFDFAPIAYFVVDQQGWIRRANLAAGDLLDTSRALLSRWLFTHFVAPDARQQWYTLLQTIFGGQSTEQAAFDMQTWRGSVFPAEIQGAVEAHDSELCLLAVKDITGQQRAKQHFEETQRQLQQQVKQKEQELEHTARKLETEQSERQHAEYQRDVAEVLYDAAVEDQIEMVSRIGADGTLTYANTALCTFLGLSEDELVGQSPDLYMHADDLDDAKVNIAKIASDSPVAVSENRVRHADGSMRWVRWINRGIFGMNGEIVEYHSVGLDIDAQKRAEISADDRYQALESIFKLATTLDRSFADVCRIAAEELSRFLNVPYITIRRFHQGLLHTVVRCRDGRIDEGGASPTNCGPCQKVLLAGQREMFVGNLRDQFPGARCFREGDYRSFVGVPIVGSRSQVLGIIGAADRIETSFTKEDLLLIDIFARYIGFEFEREAMEDRIRSSNQGQILGQVAAGVAHEVRNPLNAILVTSEVLRHAQEEGRDCAKYIDRIERQTNRLAILMKDMLELRRPIEPASFKRKPVDEFCRATVETWRQSLDEPAEVQVTMAADLDGAEIAIDPERMAQVLINLLDNAHQHNPPDGTLRLRAERQGTDWCAITIQDEGPGISPEKTARIFDPFFTTRKGGSGLGLSIVRHIVDRHGGEIRAKANENANGASMEVRLPLAEEKA